LITHYGNVEGVTGPFQPDVRVWANSPAEQHDTFYTRHGDLFVQICAVISLIAFVAMIRHEF
jgi:apolipoprotein N-acyltransferase